MTWLWMGCSEAPPSPTGGRVDTGFVSSPPAEPPSDPTEPDPPPEGIVRLYGHAVRGLAGTAVDVVPSGQDSVGALLVGAPGDYYAPGAGQLFVLREARAGGRLVDAAFAVFEGDPASSFDFGGSAAVLPSVDQVAVLGTWEIDQEIGVGVHLFPLPVLEPIVALGIDDAEAIFSPDPTLGAEFVVRATAPGGGPALGVSCIGDGALGQLIVHAIPAVPGAELVADAEAIYLGARFSSFEDDLDGDGIADLLIADPYFGVALGRIGLVLDPPGGTVVAWDLVETAIDGVVEGAEFGYTFAVGDLDGDGGNDVYSGAPVRSTPTGYVFRGPLSGLSDASGGTWTLPVGEAASFFGARAEIDDFDGDGAADLAIAAPWGRSASQVGVIYIWLAPAPGALDFGEAHTVDAPVAGSSFGWALASGDLDGDGRSEIVAGAPFDETVEVLGGSVTVVLGTFW